MWNVWKVIEEENKTKLYELIRGFDNRPLRFDERAKAEHFVETFNCSGQNYKLIITEDDPKR